MGAPFAWLLALTLRSTMVLAVALALGTLLRHGSAAARHRLLTLAALGLLLLPALPGVLPRWELGFVPRWMETPSRPPAVRPPDPASATTAPVDESVPAAPRRPARTALREGSVRSFGASFGTGAVGVWLIGVLAGLLGLVRALAREKRLVAASRPLAGPWLETLAEVRRSVAVPGEVRLLTSDEIPTPLTGGWRRPAVLLPASATHWPDERRNVVLRHELVHVVRLDTLRHLAWRVVVALYWFHPLARLAARQARIVSEQACDEAVLDLGIRPSAYARHLLEIAESLRPQPQAFANALPMIERSQLERRLLMILDPERSPGRGRAVAAVCLALLAGVVLAVGAAMPRPLAGSARAASPVPMAVEAASSVAACADGMSGSFTGFSGRGHDFTLRQHLGDDRWLCALVRGDVRFDERDGSIREMPPGSSVLVETREGRTRSRRMVVTAEQGAPRYEWWRDGVAQAPDDDARAWLADALEVAAAFRAIGSIQGRVGSLQGEIGSIQGEVGSLQGEIGSVQGEQGSLQGKIGSIQGEQGSLQGAIGSQQGAIGSLQAARAEAATAAEEARIDREIATHEAAIRKLEAEMASRGFSRGIAEVEAELRAVESSGRIAELEKRIKAVQAEERIGGLERQIEDLHADDRIREIERRMKPALDRLKSR
jgi:beta-lactamase regulating signal transducer with metallopeptidase domain/predicted  nucleic acid-binding Zn-ribbon protein